jgi:hypothetical protein
VFLLTSHLVIRPPLEELTSPGHTYSPGVRAIFGFGVRPTWESGVKKPLSYLNLTLPVSTLLNHYNPLMSASSKDTSTEPPVTPERLKMVSERTPRNKNVQEQELVVRPFPTEAAHSARTIGTIGNRRVFP